MEDLYENDPRDYALMMVEDGLISSADLAMMLVKYMSSDDVKDCLDANELSPRFGNMQVDSNRFRQYTVRTILIQQKGNYDAD